MNWFLALALALLVFAGLAYVRLAPDRAADVHVDPMTTGETTPRSVALRPPAAPVFEAAPEDVFAAADAFLRAMPHSTLIAEGPDAFHASYTVRTEVLRFPDDLSLKVTAVGDGATLAVFFRSRLGGYDWGVNAARVDRLIAHLQARFPAGT